MFLRFLLQKVMASLPLLPALAAVLCLQVQPIASFSHGASHSSCLKMIPGHIQAHPLDPQHGYVTIHTSTSLYWPGQLITVIVRSSRDFMGFLLQARSVGTGGRVAGGTSIRSKRLGPILVGGCWILTPPSTHTLHCLSDGDTVTHSDKQLKRNLSFVWRAPDTPMGDVRFHITVVQSYFVYWAGIESAVVHDGSRIYWRGYNDTVRDGEKTFTVSRTTRVSIPPTNKTFGSTSVTHSTRSTHDTLEAEGNRPILEMNTLVGLTNHGENEKSTLTSTSPHKNFDFNDSHGQNYKTVPELKDATSSESSTPTLLTFKGFHRTNNIRFRSYGPRTSTQVPKTSWIFRNQSKTEGLYRTKQTGSQTVTTETSSSQQGLPSFSPKLQTSVSKPSAVQTFSVLTQANRRSFNTLHQLKTSPTGPKSMSETTSRPKTRMVPSTSIPPRSNPLIQTQSFATFYPLNPPIFTPDQGQPSSSNTKSSADLQSFSSSVLPSSVLQSMKATHFPPSGSSSLYSVKNQPQTFPALSASSPLSLLDLPPIHPSSTSSPPSFLTSTHSLRPQNSPVTASRGSLFTGSVCSSSLQSTNSSSSSSSAPGSDTPSSFASTVTPPSRSSISTSTSSSFEDGSLSFTSGLNSATDGTIVHPNPKPFPNHRPNHDLLPDIPNIGSKPKRPSKPQTPGEDGKHPDIVPKHTAWELGVLLGGSAGFGMVLVLAVRFLYRQACGRRTQVTLNDREREYGRGEIGLIQVQECGDLVRVRKIRENSFVFLTEYDVLATSGN